MQKRYDILKPRVRAPGKRFLRLFAGTQGFFRAIFARHAFVFAGWSALALDYFFTRRSEPGAVGTNSTAADSTGGIRLSPVIKLYYNRVYRPVAAKSEAPEQPARGGMGSTAPLSVLGTRLEQLMLRTPAVDAAPAPTDANHPPQVLRHAEAAPRRVRDILQANEAQPESAAGDARDELILQPAHARSPLDRITDAGNDSNNTARKRAAGLRIFTLPHVSWSGLDQSAFPELVGAPGRSAAGPPPGAALHDTPVPLTYRPREASPRPSVDAASPAVAAPREPASVYDGVRHAPATLSAPTGEYARDAAATENFARALRELPSREVEGLAARIYSHLERKISRDLDRRGLS